ncbi:hypothetical protein ASPZODRAFT_2113943 [Penicilliopsis zonata CBS 506.65]|uniref:FAD/NAD(P)-binding domain-containing protein n=1 Tax=Penicilliopsis zonata CBS 506.65 TaxID=1073090 RepID=A0A1L9S9R6_9EURO|nr:hypothetical protein ASPZODRAFT_2113943 [Penicilliopsis zonata CBS 506.65]OJJ43910.1 hypothetical protein ASPZODRAFT_2113943 [Penicilliopsis zonata CBS 506.65]
MCENCSARRLQDTMGTPMGAHQRALRIVVIGAGISGILASIRFRQRVPNVSVCVYEKNSGVGGTWFKNKYPGCMSDHPSHSYQASFEPNLEWSHFYASADEIKKYWEKVFFKYGCDGSCRLETKVISAIWNEEKGQWLLKVADLKKNSLFDDECHLLISATGMLDDAKWPTFPGLGDFKGKVMHTAEWDKSYSYQGKKVAVIGNGSSGLQIIPALLPQVTHIDHYIKDPAWVTPTLYRETIDNRGPHLQNYIFDSADMRSFKHNQGYYERFRNGIEHEVQSMHAYTVNGTTEHRTAPMTFMEHMERGLQYKPELLAKLIPVFPPLTRPLTPAPGYLEAMTKDKVKVITKPIKKVVEKGIVTDDNVIHEVDLVVCATGFDTSFIPNIYMVGRNNQTLRDKWRKYPETYLGIMTDGFPNYFIAFGPNTGLATGNQLLLLERQIDYFTSAALKMQRDDIRAMAPRADKVQSFVTHCEQYFKGTIFKERCSSWYKAHTENGPVIGLWPGSGLHAVEALKNPRWEDFSYEYIDPDSMSWLGNGWTLNETRNDISIDYLSRDQIDYPNKLKVFLPQNSADSDYDEQRSGWRPRYQSDDPRWDAMSAVYEGQTSSFED